MKRKIYEKELRKLRTELCLLQEWVVHAGLRVIVVFEGRDAAGKGGTIKAISVKGEYDDQAALKARTFVPEKY
jgi:polyphosphate kinase 2 (PPK2 family)